MDRENVSWSDVERMTRSLGGRLAGERFDAILGILRGGLVPACLLSQHLGLRPVLAASVASYEGRARSRARFFQFPPARLVRGRRILVVDDIWDSGRTAMAVRSRLEAAGAQPVLAVLHFKPDANHFPGREPDVFVAATSAWITYPWESEALPHGAGTGARRGRRR